MTVILLVKKKCSGNPVPGEFPGKILANVPDIFKTQVFF